MRCFYCLETLNKELLISNLRVVYLHYEYNIVSESSCLFEFHWMSLVLRNTYCLPFSIHITDTVKHKAIGSLRIFYKDWKLEV